MAVSPPTDRTRDSGSPGPARPPDPAAIVFLAHPPERAGRSRGIIAPCSCCCCCCVHSLGGLIGASLASAPAPDAAPSVRSVVAVYWGACAALAVLCLLFLSFGDASVGLILLALALPAVQIAASLVTVLVVAVGSFDDKKQCLAKIGMITGATIVGTLLGLAVTIPLLLGLAG